MFASKRRFVVASLAAAGLTLSTFASAQAATQPAAPAAAAPAPAPAPSPASAPAAAPPAAQPPDAVPAIAAGSHPAPNSIFLEGLGAAFAYSVNYERIIADVVAVRGGFGYLTISATTGNTASGGQTSGASASYLWIPITASYIGLRSGKHSLEVGGGMTFLDVSSGANAAGVSTSGGGVLPYGVAMIGYRFHPLDHLGFQFRIGYNALFGNGMGLQDPNPSKFGVIHWPYVSVGASF